MNNSRNKIQSRWARCYLPAVLVCAAPVFAATVTVCPSGCNQTTIVGAIAAANPGDTILIGQGTYAEAPTFSKDAIVQGAGADKTIISGPATMARVQVSTGASVELHGLTINGGGRGVLNYGQLTIADSIVSGNGDGITNYGPSLSVLRTTIRDNGNGGWGAGVSTWLDGSVVTVVDSAIFNNIANIQATGLISVGAGNIQVQNSTIGPNTNSGGSVVFFPGGNVATLPKLPRSAAIYNSTLVMTDPSAFAGILSLGMNSSVVIQGSILLTAPGVPVCHAQGVSVLSLGHNLSSDASCPLDGPGDLPNNMNAKLGPLQVNAPGTTASYSLLPGSAAIDSGFCAGVFVDQRGVKRPQGTACDIGSVEMRVPVANADAYSTGYGKELMVPAPGVLGNDSSPDFAPGGVGLKVGSATTVQNGTLIIATDGSIQYMPKSGFSGADTFTYTAFDGLRYSAPATVTINVKPANVPPVAQNDSYTVVEGQTLTVTATAGVLANDRDPDGDPITAIPVTKPVSGHFDYFNSDGSFRYVPNPGFYGVDTFTYQAYDGMALSNIATVTLTVIPSFGTITITATSEPQTSAAWSFSGSLGAFSLGGTSVPSRTFQVNPGTYTISESVPGGWLLANVVCNPVAGVNVNLSLGNVQLTVANGGAVTCTFQNQEPGKLTTRVYFDWNRNMAHDNGEPFLNNWTIQLYTLSPTPVATSVTAGGKAVFSNLTPRIYTVCEVLKAGWIALTPALPDPNHGKPCRTVQVNPGQNTDVLFGNVPSR